MEGKKKGDAIGERKNWDRHIAALVSKWPGGIILRETRREVSACYRVYPGLNFNQQLRQQHRLLKFSRYSPPRGDKMASEKILSHTHACTHTHVRVVQRELQHTCTAQTNYMQMWLWFEKFQLQATQGFSLLGSRMRPATSMEIWLFDHKTSCVKWTC